MTRAGDLCEVEFAHYAQGLVQTLRIVVSRSEVDDKIRSYRIAWPECYVVIVRRVEAT